MDKTCGSCGNVKTLPENPGTKELTRVVCGTEFGYRQVLLDLETTVERKDLELLKERSWQRHEAAEEAIEQYEKAVEEMFTGLARVCDAFDVELPDYLEGYAKEDEGYHLQEENERWEGSTVG